MSQMSISERMLTHILKLQRELLATFEDSSVTEGGHPTNTSGVREAKLREIVGRFQPHPSTTTDGVIFDAFNRDSHAADCVVLAANHPQMFDPGSERIALRLADGVIAAIELKDSLKYLPKTPSKGGEVITALQQVEKTKQLRRRTPWVRDLAMMGMPASLELQEYSTTIPTYIMARVIGDVKKFAQYIDQYYQERKTPLLERVDLIVSLEDGKGIFIPKFSEVKFTSKDKTKTLSGIYAFETANPLALLLLALAYEPRSNQIIEERPFFARYITDEHWLGQLTVVGIADSGKYDFPD